MEKRFESFLIRLARLQVNRPWVLIAVVIASLIPAGYAASKLSLRTSFTELLPDTKPSVVEMRRVQERLPGNSTLTVVLEGDDTEALKRFVDALTPKLQALGPELVAAVDDGNRRVRRFFEKNKHLYADLADIREIHDQLLARYDWEVGRASGMDLGLSDEEPPELDPKELEVRFKKKADDAERLSPGLDGYYIGEDGKLAAVLVRTPFGTGDQRAFELKERVRNIIEGLDPKRFHPSLRFGFTGNLITSAEAQRAITNDLAHVGVWGVGLILGVVFLFFLKLRTLLAMTLTIGTGCIWAFGVAYLSVGYLNTATDFLVSIIAGNGINFGIIYMARYIEERRDRSLPVPQAIEAAHRGTHGATLAAAGAAMIAYGSLSLTDFRGFKHFGIIGGAGMLLCWVATYLLLPAVLVVTERFFPLYGSRTETKRRVRGVYGYPFVYLARRFPRAITAIGLATGVVSIALAAKYFAEDPMEYKLQNVRNERLDPTSAGLLSLRVDKIVGRLGQDGRAVVADRVEQVKPLVEELERRRRAAPPDRKPFQKVVSIYDLLPKDQEAKLPLLEAVRDRLERARRRGLIDDSRWNRLEKHIPDAIQPITIDDLPREVARPFEEKDGRRGTIVYIVPTEGRSVYDAHYLKLWADSFREIRLPGGELIRGSGDPVIFTDMLAAVREDAPKAIFWSFVGTALVIFVAFRGRIAAVVTFGTLLMGLAWLVAFLFLKDIKLNFLNFVALPITVGVGADYALNVMKRRELEGDGDLFKVFVETGGAVVLCSLTTTLGYLALLLSINRAVQSFGLAAAAGEVTTLVAAMLWLPAFLFVRAKRSAANPPAPVLRDRFD